jgi:hypothetical protein
VQVASGIDLAVIRGNGTRQVSVSSDQLTHQSANTGEVRCTDLLVIGNHDTSTTLDRATMTSEDPVFKAFNDFGIDDIPTEAVVSLRMLRRLKDIDDVDTVGPTGPAARAALACSVVAHAVVELETRLIELQRQLAIRD